MCILNFVVYVASSLYVPGEQSLTEEFGVSTIVATLGLSLFSVYVIPNALPRTWLWAAH
jgi:DHA1 family multidrug resistance protein-like MFS transporter